MADQPLLFEPPGNDQRERLRATFDTVPELYDRARPQPPDELVADFVEAAGLTAGDSVVEIGPGTGQLSVQLAAGGLAVTGVELGANLAAVARRNLAPFPSCRIDVAAFEDWPGPGEPARALISASAWNWVDPAVRVRRAAGMLAPGGTLAVIGGTHVAGVGDAFFERVQACYLRWMPGTRPDERRPALAEISRAWPEAGQSGLFGQVEVRAYAQDVEYSTEQYLDVLGTYSGHLALDPGRRASLLTCIAEIADREFGGRITKTYGWQLRTARRL
jgi:SAM-dependent methyltransferase